MGKPSPFDVLELGANDASLCSDILNEINSIAPEIVMRYHIVEPLAQLTEWQQSKLAASHSESVSHYASIDDLPELQGVFLSNELFDAFPVEQVKADQGQWKQLRISSDGDQFRESWQSIDPSNTELLTFTESLEATLPDGYRTEFRPGLDVFIHSITQKFSSAMVLAIDYGFPRSHFYHKSRAEGTLQTYFNHQKDDLPLVDPGNKDITAHVDFTQLSNTFASNGWKIYDFSPQSRYLTTHAKLWLQQIESIFNSATLPLIKQFQTLSHPGMMGRQFHILEMTKDLTFTTPPCTQRPEEVLEM
jgi:SAM-dependent MidA family methyltransferase